MNIDFDFFSPNPEVDYHAINNLLRQLFQQDADSLCTDKLTDLILSQPAIGSTVKTDGMDSDPYAFLTVLNMHIHHQHPSIKAIVNYCLKIAAASGDHQAHASLRTLFSQDQQHVGFVISERLINMPVQIVPPMYKMLADEIEQAASNVRTSVYILDSYWTDLFFQNEPYNFSHFLFISRNYHLTPEEESSLVNSAPPQHSRAKPSKKSKTASLCLSPEPPVDGIHPFHLEDEQICALALYSLDYKYTGAPKEPREKQGFGLDYRARMMVVPTENFEPLVNKLKEIYAEPWPNSFI